MDRNFNNRDNNIPSNDLSENNSVKTSYSRRHQIPKNQYQKVQFEEPNNQKKIKNFQNHPKHNSQYNLPDTNRVFNTNLQEEPHYYYVKNIKSYRPNDNWNSMMSRTSNEESICGNNQRISKSKTYQSTIFPNENEKYEPKRMSKEAEFSNHLTQTQIVNLPGGIKRGTYEIKDDKYFDNKRNIGHIYKLNKDFNADIILRENLKDENNENVYPSERFLGKNPYPVQQRFKGSFHNKNYESGIFDMNRKEDAIRPGKKMFNNIPYMKSQFELA